MHSSNKKLKLPFRKTQLGIQSLSYVGPNTQNSIPNNLKSATSVNSFKDYNKEYFLKKLGSVEVDIYSYTQIDPKTMFATFLEFMQNRMSIVLPFSLFQYQSFFQCFQSFLYVIFQFINFNIPFFLREHNGNKALQLFVPSLLP